MRLMKGKELRKHAVPAIREGLNGKMFPKETLFDWLIQCSELLAYVESKKIIHRDPHFGNFMIDDDGKITLTDFGNGAYLENDMVTENHDCHGPWGYGPEGYTGEDYSYKADIPCYGREFAALASPTGHDPYETLIGKIDVDENGNDGARLLMKDLVKGGNYKLTFEGAEKYGPEFEKLLASMFAHNPEDRPTFAEVAAAAKKLT
jgi:serine/threonine protein kinase